MDFNHFESISDDRFMNLMGISKSNFKQIISICQADSTCKRNWPINNCLAILLIKLRTDLSIYSISALFDIHPSTASRQLKKGRELLMEYFVPKFLGTEHISHEDFVLNHTRIFAQQLFSTESEAILVADGTYIYIEKSSNYKFQRMSYSQHKNRPLLKPMILTSTTGYILDVFGPYYANAANNDANILIHLLKDNTTKLRQWMKDKDILVVDRGFRDALDFLKELNYENEMPHFLPKNQCQHSTQEANESRIVTSVRWVIEAVNGLIKNWKSLRNVLPNSQIPYVGDYLRIVCALCNAFRPPRVVDTSFDTLKAENMLKKLKTMNNLQERVSRERLATKRACWDEIHDLSIPEFPTLTMSYLQEITFGVYQIKQAISYTEEHCDDNGLYNLFIHKESDCLIRVKIQSRHVSSKQYSLWIEFSSSTTAPISGWYCQCKSGARTVGCCAHIASVLWYLGYYRHQEKSLKRLAPEFENYVEDANGREWEALSDTE